MSEKCETLKDFLAEEVKATKNLAQEARNIALVLQECQRNNDKLVGNLDEEIKDCKLRFVSKNETQLMIQNLQNQLTETNDRMKFFRGVSVSTAGAVILQLLAVILALLKLKS